MLYRSIRLSLSSSSAFLWIRNLASPDFCLTLLILFMTGLSMYLMPSASGQGRSVLIAIQVIITFLIVWKLAAGLGLYWLSSGAVGILQTVWIRYGRDRRGATLDR
jgi:YidC/Oxa1 family membrane protein insertase